MTRRTLLWASGLILAALAGLGAVANRGTPPEELDSPPALPVHTWAVTPVESFLQRRIYTGVVRAARRSELGFERTGRIVSVSVSEGEVVAAGQILARLDTRNLEARLRELGARRAAARALLDELVAGPRSETIAAAQAEVRDLQAQLELARLQYRRSEALVEENAISREEYEQKSLGRQSTEAQLDAAQRRLDELQAGTRSEKIEAQRAVVAQLDAALEDVKIDLEESALVAPFAGTIAKRHLDEGTMAAPATPVLRLVENGRLEAWIGLPADTAAQLDDQSIVEVEVGRRSYTAGLAAVLPELDPATRTRTAIFELSAPDGSVVPSQVVRVRLREPSEASGFWLPTAALTRGSRGLWSVLVAEQDEASGQSIAARRDVELLHTDGEQVLVRGTLRAGDRVIAGGTHRLVAGQIVEVVEQDVAQEK